MNQENILFHHLRNLGRNHLALFTPLRRPLEDSHLHPRQQSRMTYSSRGTTYALIHDRFEVLCFGVQCGNTGRHRCYGGEFAVDELLWRGFTHGLGRVVPGLG